MTYAAIDIGSNAVRLLIKRDEARCRYLDKLILVRVPLRLGFDVFKNGVISDDKTSNLMDLMRSYALLMKIYKVDILRACATSAMRDASNGHDIITRIKENTGIDVEIITGAEEAKIVYNNHQEQGFDKNGNYLYVDVGGGSTELNLLSKGELKFSRSFNIGTVRMLTGNVKANVWAELCDLCMTLRKEYQNLKIVGSGGNINKLYKLIGEKKPKRIRVEDLKELYDEMSAMTMEERMVKYTMRPDRADVIIPASNIFLTIANLAGVNTILVPVIGVADGIIDGLARENHSVCLAQAKDE